MNIALKFIAAACIAAILAGCEQSGSGTASAVPLAPAHRPPAVPYRRSGNVQAAWLDEISGIQASLRHPGRYWVHDDDGKARIGVIDETGAYYGRIELAGVINRDWEAITLVPREGRDLLVVADTGDNEQIYPSVTLLFVEEPEPAPDGTYSGSVEVYHRLELVFPDHPRDTEAVAYDPRGERILFVTKRDIPPQLYAVTLEEALAQDQAELQFHGETVTFRPPETADLSWFGKRARWVSQPTGMDISPDGSMAGVITYRSLYLFRLPESGDWHDGLRSEPQEIFGPPALQEEAVTFTADGSNLVVTSEGARAPVYFFRPEIAAAAND